MQLERKALYNFLGIQWRLNPQLQVKPWQIQDWRTVNTDTLFAQLAALGIVIDRAHFLAWTDKCDTPEELADYFCIEEETSDQETQDQIFLLTFELWRRLAPEKPSLSLLCDELDHQIQLYDDQEGANGEAIQDAIANLQTVLEEWSDRGASPREIMQTVETHCANDLESFLYDYIRDQIDLQQYDYATELLESFESYAHDAKWFRFLRARVLASSDPNQADVMVRTLIQGMRKEPHLEFCFELLEHLAGQGSPQLFVTLAKVMLPLLEMEEDLQDYLAISLNYFARLDLDPQAQTIQQMLSNRQQQELGHPIDPLDATLPQIAAILETDER